MAASHGAIPSTEALDFILTAQLVVAWAGEGGDEPRLGWWRCDMLSEYGGEDLLQRVLPKSWRWAVYQAARQAARLHDRHRRDEDHSPDTILSLYNLGFEVNERLDERFQQLKRAGTPPHDALPLLAQRVTSGWDRAAFEAWLREHGEVKHTQTPVGRKLSGKPPAQAQALVRQLLGALLPLGDAYPLPHMRRKE